MRTSWLLLTLSFTALAEEATPENNIVCFAAKDQWVCAPAAEQEQAQIKAERLLDEPDPITESKPLPPLSNEPFDRMVEAEPKTADVVVRPMAQDRIEPKEEAPPSQPETQPLTQPDPSVANTVPEPAIITPDPESVTTTPSREAVPSGAQSFTAWQRDHGSMWSWQVIGTSNRHKLNDFLAQHGLSDWPHTIVKTQANGADWWVVLAGLYPTRDAAIDSRFELPADLADAAWVRQIQSIDGAAD